MFKIFNTTASVAALSALGLGACLAAPQPTETVEDDALQTVEQIMAPWASGDAPGVAVAVSLKDEIVFARGAGMANLEHSIPIAADSVFQVASVSKQFTAFAILLLASDGAIDLDEDIRTYVPEMPPTESIITVRHLLDHASGLRERNTLAGMAGWMADDIRTEAQMRALVRRQTGLNFEPGTEIEYSNTGYALLAEIVERVSGQTFSTFTEERMFKPLGMVQTRFPEIRNDVIPSRASSYYPSSGGFKNVVAVSETTGSTGLYTTALDLLKWAENFETQAVGDAFVFEAMAERFQAMNGDDSTFAKGQELRVYKGVETWSHGGTDAGYRSFLLRVPDKDLEIAVLSNRTDFDKAAFAFSVADAYLPASASDAAQDWSQAKPEELAAYAGDYEIFSGAIFSIRAEAGGLTFASFGAPRDDLQPLPQIGPREFLLNAEPERSLIFDTPIKGESAKLGYRIGLDGTLDAPRIALAPFDTTSVELSDYVGRCFSEELAVQYDLSLIDGMLIARHARLPEFALTPYQENTFLGQGPLQKLVFKTDTEGEIIGFHASAPLADDIWFLCN